MSVKTSGLLNKRIMSERKTVLVVGAGASNEVNIPIGKDLTKYIAKYLNIRQGEVKREGHQGRSRVYHLAYLIGSTNERYKQKFVRNVLCTEMP